MRAYSKEEIEAVLFEHHFIVLQEKDGFAVYTTNFDPPADIVIDWNIGVCYWERLEPELRFYGVDTVAIYQSLKKLH